MSSTDPKTPQEPSKPTNPAEQAAARKPKRRRPDLDTMYTINEDGSRNFIQPADVDGRWTKRVNVFWLLLVVIYAGLPWIDVGGHPAVHIDLANRQAHLFGLGFSNQDFYLMFFVLTGFGFGLFVVTALFGRVWCGFACPQTVFMEGIFRKVERLIEGPRNRRIRRNMGPVDADKIWRKGLKHVVFLGLSYTIAHIFLSYFIPVERLLQVIQSPPSENMAAFGWTMFFTGLMYFDYAWFREQTCLVICPYGRLQSALIDKDTVVIGYDQKRGEPRAPGGKQGDCVDCFRCVEVCPTGIDIRNGLQMECIGCTRCIDACDDVMRRFDKPEGLVRFDSRESFDGGKRRSLLRPRVFLYVFLGLVGLSVATFMISNRDVFHANILRTRGMPYTLEGERVRNLVNMHLQNKQSFDMVLQIEPVDADLAEYVIPQPVVRLGPGEDADVPLFLYVERADFAGQFPVSFTVTDSVTGEAQELTMTFRGP